MKVSDIDEGRCELGLRKWNLETRHQKMPDQNINAILLKRDDAASKRQYGQKFRDCSFIPHQQRVEARALFQVSVPAGSHDNVIKSRTSTPSTHHEHTCRWKNPYDDKSHAIDIGMGSANSRPVRRMVIPTTFIFLSCLMSQ